MDDNKEDKTNSGPQQLFESKHANNNGLFLQTSIYDKSVDCLVDTGATISVLHSEVYLQLRESRRPTLKKNCGHLRVADGKVIVPLGVAKFPVKISGQVRECRMIVADIEVPAVIGYDFMKVNNCSMHLGNGTMTMNGKRVTCYLEGQRSTSIFGYLLRRI